MQYIDASERIRIFRHNFDNEGFVVAPNPIDALWIRKLQIRFDEVMEEGNAIGRLMPHVWRI